MVGVADGFGASIINPGHIHHNAMKLIRFGELEGGKTKRLNRNHKGFKKKQEHIVFEAFFVFWSLFMFFDAFDGTASKCTLLNLNLKPNP